MANSKICKRRPHGRFSTGTQRICQRSSRKKQKQTVVLVILGTLRGGSKRFSLPWRERKKQTLWYSKGKFLLCGKGGWLTQVWTENQHSWCEIILHHVRRRYEQRLIIPRIRNSWIPAHGCFKFTSSWGFSDSSWWDFCWISLWQIWWHPQQWLAIRYGHWISWQEQSQRTWEFAHTKTAVEHEVIKFNDGWHFLYSKSSCRSHIPYVDATCKKAMKIGCASTTG